MTNKKTTKKALIFSALSLLLCFSMLVGTTFAWFTDSVTSAGNIIQSGTLDVALEWADGTEALDAAQWTDASAGEIFNNDKWEPGYTEARHLKISNEGTLALKYELAIIPNGTVSALADVIDVYYVDGGVAVADRTALKNMAPVGTLRDLINGEICSGSLEADGEKIVTIVLKMQESAGNEYQDLSIGTDFAIQLLATQMTSESDSFDNQYDANAPYSIWDGTVPTEMPETLVVDGKTQTVHVKDAAAFAYLSTLSAKWVELYTDGNGTTYTNYANGAGANYYYSGDWTVSLEADIDLNNYALAPVDIVLGQSTGATAFNGNYHTIRNVTAGLFADGTRASFSNLTLENVVATNGALAGSVNHSVTNVTVKNATVSGTDYVGGLVGKTYSSINGCQVIDSSVTATGKEAGGLVGYAEANSKGSIITYNVVRNVSVFAGNRAAGLVAQSNTTVKVYNNTVDTVTVGAEDTSSYQPGAVVSNALNPENVYDNIVKNANVATKAATATDNATFDTALKDGADTIFLGSGEYIVPDSAKGKTLTIVGNGDTVVASQDDGAAEGDCDYSFDGSTVTFENVTITTSTTYFPGYARMKGIYNNCTINGVYTLYDNSEFNNCTFNVSGDVYNVWTWGAAVATFNGCTFNNDGKAILLYGTANTKLTVNDCTFNDNGGLTDLKAAIEIGNDYNKSYELIVNNTVVNGYEINDKGINTGSTLWANKNSMGTDKLNVVIDGVDVY